MSDKAARLRDYVHERFAPHLHVEELTPETSLLEGGILQSIDVIDLVLFLEKEFEVRIPAHQVSPENFESLAAIERLLVESRPAS